MTFIKNCPLCNGVSTSLPDISHWWYVRCNNCGLKIPTSKPTKEEAIRSWNTRAALENAAVNQELLEVAKAVSNDWDELGKDFWGLPIPIRMSTINAAKQAIAKAEGKNE